MRRAHRKRNGSMREVRKGSGKIKMEDHGSCVLGRPFGADGKGELLAGRRVGGWNILGRGSSP